MSEIYQQCVSFDRNKALNDTQTWLNVNKGVPIPIEIATQDNKILRLWNSAMNIATQLVDSDILPAGNQKTRAINWNIIQREFTPKNKNAQERCLLPSPAEMLKSAYRLIFVEFDGTASRNDSAAVAFNCLQFISLSASVMRFIHPEFSEHIHCAIIIGEKLINESLISFKNKRNDRLVTDETISSLVQLISASTLPNNMSKKQLRNWEYLHSIVERLKVRRSMMSQLWCGLVAYEFARECIKEEICLDEKKTPNSSEINKEKELNHSFLHIGIFKRLANIINM